ETTNDRMASGTRFEEGRMTMRRWVLAAIPALAAAIGLVGWTHTAPAADPAKIVGPAARGEGHKGEGQILQKNQHQPNIRHKPRKPEATDIATKMGIERIRTESLCSNCHFTLQTKDGKEEPVAGVSCESCHGAAAGWVKLHGNFSGKKKDTETPAERDK